VLRGGVKITRGADQLNGDAAEIDLNTGVSRLLSSGSGRVRGVFGPKNLRPKTKPKNKSVN
jgi:lipopolysaccharide export system protein LptA